MPLEARVGERRSLTTTLLLDGRLDGRTVATSDQNLDRALDLPVKVLVFDLSKLEYISSAGLPSLFRAQKSMRARSGRSSW